MKHTNALHLREYTMLSNQEDCRDCNTVDVSLRVIAKKLSKQLRMHLEGTVWLEIERHLLQNPTDIRRLLQLLVNALPSRTQIVLGTFLITTGVLSATFLLHCFRRAVPLLNDSHTNNHQNGDHNDHMSDSLNGTDDTSEILDEDDVDTAFARFVWLEDIFEHHQLTQDAQSYLHVLAIATENYTISDLERLLNQTIFLRAHRLARIRLAGRTETSHDRQLLLDDLMIAFVQTPKARL